MDHGQAALPKCTACKGEIKERNMVTAINNTYHPEHFRCCLCDSLIVVGEEFYENESEPYCQHCYKHLYFYPCAGCSQALNGETYVCLGKRWHPDCLCCKVCRQLFADSKCYVINDEVYCHEHYWQVKGNYNGR